MEIQDLDSYNLFQEINDKLFVMGGFIKKNEKGLAIKETFIITKSNEILFYDEKTEEDKNFIVKWIDNERSDLMMKIKDCITTTNENFVKFKSENPSIKEEVKMREKDLKKALRYLEDIILDPLSYEEILKVKQGPEINSDYAGISVKETKYFLM